MKLDADVDKQVDILEANRQVFARQNCSWVTMLPNSERDIERKTNDVGPKELGDDKKLKVLQIVLREHFVAPGWTNRKTYSNNIGMRMGHLRYISVHREWNTTTQEEREHFDTGVNSMDNYDSGNALKNPCGARLHTKPWPGIRSVSK